MSKPSEAGLPKEKQSIGKLKAAGTSTCTPASTHSVPAVNPKQSLFISGELAGLEINILVDTGAAVSLVSETVFRKVNIKITEGRDNIVGACGEPMFVLGQASCVLKLGRQTINHNFYIVRDLHYECLLGVDFLKKNQCDILLSEGTIKINGEQVSLNNKNNEGYVKFKAGNNVTETGKMGCSVSWGMLINAVTVPGRSEIIVTAKIPEKMEGEVIVEPNENLYLRTGITGARVLAKVREDTVPVRLINCNSEAVKLVKGLKIVRCETTVNNVDYLTNKTVAQADIAGKIYDQEASKLFDFTQCTLNHNQMNELKTLINEYSDIMSRSEDDLGRTGVVKHKIDTGSARPIKQPPRRLPFQKREEARQIVTEMEKAGVIRKSTSAWASPVVLVRKKNGNWRFCVDYRRLNDITVKDAYPLPRIDDILDTLSGAKYFSTIDMASGYWQCEVQEEDRPKTAFVTTEGLYEFNVMPFGLCNAPSTYQRLMDLTLAGLQWKTSLIYLDDVIIFGNEFGQHLNNLRDVFERIRAAKLKINPKKCQLSRTSVHFLGHIVSAEGVRTDPQKTLAVKNWATPSNVDELRAFIGTASYYRRFIKNFASIAAPLHNLTKKGQKFTWDTYCENAFRELKGKLITAPVLAYPLRDCEFIVDTDASNTGLGAVLSQIQEGEERVIAYLSRSLSKPELKYCVTRKELLALIWATRHWRHYLLGKRFRVRTDHSALKWLQNFKEPEGQLARWLESLSEFDMAIEHRPGKQHGNADGLSRIPCKQCGHKVESQFRIGAVGDDEDGTRDTSWIESYSMGDLLNFQKEDPALNKVRLWLLRGRRPPQNEIQEEPQDVQALWYQFHNLKLVNSVIYRQYENTLQLIIPEGLRNEMLKEAHNSIFSGGHLGTAKTLEKLRQRCYWPGLKASVEEWCKKCEDCARRKMPSKYPRAPLGTYIVGAPLERIALDILGPLPKTTRGNKYILVISDYFTRWVEAFSMPDQETGTVAKILVEEFICRYGLPKELHSDQGRQFEAKVFQDICKLLAINKTRTTSYHPQSDGLVERFNRTLLGMLSQFVNESHNNWDEKIPYVMMAYRASVQKATKFSPYYLMFGREPQLVQDIVFPDVEQATDTENFVDHIKNRLRDSYEETARNLKSSHDSNKKYYDQKCSGKNYSEGDRVWLYNPVIKKGTCKKFHKPWSGPYVIKKVMSEVTFRIQHCQNNRKRLVVHFNRLKPCISSGEIENAIEQTEERNVTEREIENNNTDRVENNGNVGEVGPFTVVKTLRQPIMVDQAEEPEDGPEIEQDNPNEPEQRRYPQRVGRRQTQFFQAGFT